METKKEKVSYCIGAEAGRNIGSQFDELDFLQLVAGFKDGIEKKPLALPPHEMNEIQEKLREEVVKQRQRHIEQLAAKNKDEGEQFLLRNHRNPDVKVLPSGLQYEVLVSGTGRSPKSYEKVLARYKGSLLNGAVFDQTLDSDPPRAFVVAETIPGWSEAIQMMRVGDKWRVFVPSYLAYREHGRPGTMIEPNMVLIFEIELVDILEN